MKNNLEKLYKIKQKTILKNVVIVKNFLFL